MPIYLYKNKRTGEVKEVLQAMNDKHVYFEDGIEWKRIFLAPNTSIDTDIDPFSQDDFRERTGQKKGTIGDMLDYSAEMSERRAEKCGGEDPVKKKYFDDYAKKRGGKRHFAEKKTYESENVKVEYD